MELRESAITKLATVETIDMNAVAATNLFTVPEGKVLIVTHVVVRGASVSMDTADFGFGIAATETDVIEHGVLAASLTAATLYEVLIAKAGAIVGVAAEIFKIGVDVAQGAAATMDVDVFGFIIDA